MPKVIEHKAKTKQSPCNPDKPFYQLCLKVFIQRKKSRLRRIPRKIVVKILTLERKYSHYIDDIAHADARFQRPERYVRLLRFRRKRDVTANTSCGRDGIDGTRHNVSCAVGTIDATQFIFQQLRVGQNNPELVVQLMEQPREIRRARLGKPVSGSTHHRKWNVIGHADTQSKVLCRSRNLLPFLAVRLAVWLTPQGVDKNSHRPTGSPHVLNLSAGNPVIDGSTADSHHITGFHNRNCFSVDNHLRRSLFNLQETRKRPE
jgi:hypothetical protein